MPNESESGNFLKSLLIGTPVAIGGVQSLRGLFQDLRAGITRPLNPIPARTHQALENVVRNFQTAHDPIIQSWQTRQIDKLASSTPLSKTNVLELIRRHIRFNDPTGKLGSIIEDRLQNARTGQETLESFREYIKGSDSIYVQRLGSDVVQDLEITTKRAEAGLPIKTTRIASKVPRTFTQVDPNTLYPGMKENIFKIAETLGANVKITEIARTDIRGAELEIKYLFESGEKATLRLPRVLPENPAIITHGATQQSRYIAGMYGLVENNQLVSTLNHEQYALHRAAEELVPKFAQAKRLERGYINALFNQLQIDTLEAPDWVPSIDEAKHRGVGEYINWRSQILRLKTITGKPIDEFDMYKIMLKGGLETPEGGFQKVYPGYSPAQIAGGVVSTADIREASFLVPEAIPWGRRPGQWLRSAATPTEEALQAMGMDPFTGIATPKVKTAFIGSQYIPEFAGTGISPEGQYVVSKRLHKELGVKTWRQFDISSRYIQDLSQVVDISGEGAAYQNITGSLPEGALLGYDPRGKPVVLPKNVELIHATMFEQDRAKGNFIRAMGLETINRPETAKFFGYKGMAKFVSPEYIEEVLTQQGKMPQTRGDLFRNIDAVMTMDEMKKNRALHYHQMLTSLHDYTKQNMAGGKRLSTLAVNFSDNPYAAVEEFRALARTGDAFSHEKMMSSIMGLAREAKLTPEQMGHVFGAVPDIYGDLDILGQLSPKETKEIKKGIAFGTTELFFESTLGPGSGKMATMEPRMFSMLSGPQYGLVGSEIQADLAQRMLATYPEKLIEQRELATSIRSIQNLQQRKGALEPTQILAGLGEQGIPETPVNLKIKGVGDIYIPGGRQLSQLALYQTPAGHAVNSTLALTYRNLIDAAARHQAGALNREDLNWTLTETQREAGKAWIGTVTGKTGGLLRDRIPGSVFLTSMEPTLAQARGLQKGTVGITDPFAQQMFTQMEQLNNVYDPADIDKMRLAWKEGKNISGVLGRHPYIGPFSSQPVQFTKVAGTEATALINEQRQRAIIFKGQIKDNIDDYIHGAKRAFQGNERAVNKFKQMGAEVLSSPLRLSPLVGLAGDVDGDIVSAMFAGPQLQGQLTEFIGSEQWQKMYEQHQIRIQLLKSKATEDTLSIASMRKATAGDVAKLGITEGGRLAKLSVEHSKFKAALLSGSHKMAAQDMLNALALLEWMEQAPISAKHIQSGRELELIHLMDDMTEAMRTKNTGLMTESIRTVMSHAKQSGLALMENEGITAFTEDLQSRQVKSSYIAPLDIDKTVENLMATRRSFESTPIGRTTAAKIEETIMGRGRMTPALLESMLQPEALKQSQFGPFFAASTENVSSTGLGRKLSMQAIELRSKIATAGKGLIKHAKPLAIGSAIGLGMAALISRPPSFPHMNARVTPDLTSGTGGANMPTNIHPDGRISGRPTTSNPVSSMNSSRLASDQNHGYRVSIQGTSNHEVDMQQLSEQLRRATGGARVDSTIRDTRSTLTPQRLSSILGEG